MPGYTALSVPFGTVFFTLPTLKYMWDRRRTCADFLTFALQERGCPCTVEEVTWWMDRFGHGPKENYTFNEFIDDFFLRGYTLQSSLKPKHNLIKGTFYVRKDLRTTKYGLSDMASIFNATKSKWKQDFYVLNFKGIAQAFETAQKRAPSIDRYDYGTVMTRFPVRIPDDEWVKNVDSMFLRLLKSTCAEDYIHAQMDQGQLLTSSTRPFIPPEKFSTMGLTENPWGIPIAVMRMLDAHSREWPAYMQGKIDLYLGEGHRAYMFRFRSEDIEGSYQRDNDWTLVYAEALKDTVKKFAANDAYLLVIAENFLRFSKNIKAMNKKMRDAQDDAFNTSLVVMIAGMALGYGLSAAFGPYLSSVTSAVSSTVGKIAGFVTQQLANLGIKQIVSALIGSIVSPPEFDPPTILASLPMPQSPIDIAQISSARSAAASAMIEADEALMLANMRAQNAPDELSGALQKAKYALELATEAHDETSFEILTQVKTKLDQAYAIMRGTPYVPPTLPGAQVPALPGFEDEPPLPAPVTAGASSGSGGGILALVALGFALAMPKQRGKK